jgi:hypothetical protein
MLTGIQNACCKDSQTPPLDEPVGRFHGVYAAKHGETALHGKGGNSPFAIAAGT